MTKFDKSEGFAKIDYRSTAARKSDRARVSKANLIAIGAAVAIVLGLAIVAISGN